MMERNMAAEDVVALLFDQQKACVLVEPTERHQGFWFGAGSLVVHNQEWYLIGRYRDDGDSRTALEKGVRGRELALFVSTDEGKTWTKRHSWTKSDLQPPESEVLSIEGSELVISGGHVYVFVSSEKKRKYPSGLEPFQKIGTGVWSIDYFSAPTVDQLDPKHSETGIQELLKCHDPEHLHVKDPYVPYCHDGLAKLVFCAHSFAWTEGHSGLADIRLDNGSAIVNSVPSLDLFPRGRTWDVATARITGGLDLSALASQPSISTDSPSPKRRKQDNELQWIFFYDGAESFREHPQNDRGVHRPRGYCCEELGGVLIGQLDQLSRISRLKPLMVSPSGTGCSRYHRVCVTETELIATWQQSAPDNSQPLVCHRIPKSLISALLSV